MRVGILLGLENLWSMSYNSGVCLCITVSLATLCVDVKCDVSIMAKICPALQLDMSVILGTRVHIILTFSI
jgi:hypothetical protein